MLAYVFWHWPRPGVEPGEYGDRLARFHRDLAARAPAGFLGSRVFVAPFVPGVPPAPGLLEDWYFVDGFAALGVLNEAAVEATRRGVHDAAASLARGGTAGLYKLCSPRARDARWAAWFSKPEGSSYAALFESVAAAEGRFELWQRQLVLGPAPEFCALGPSAEGLGALGALEATASPLRVLFDEPR